MKPYETYQRIESAFLSVGRDQQLTLPSDWSLLRLESYRYGREPKSWGIAIWYMTRDQETRTEQVTFHVYRGECEFDSQKRSYLGSAPVGDGIHMAFVFVERKELDSRWTLKECANPNFFNVPPGVVAPPWGGSEE